MESTQFDYGEPHGGKPISYLGFIKGRRDKAVSLLGLPLKGEGVGMRFVITTEKELRAFQSFDLLMCLDKLGLESVWQNMGYTGDFKGILEHNDEYESPERMGWDTIWDTHIDFGFVDLKMKNVSDSVTEAVTSCQMRAFVVPSDFRPPSPRNDPRIDILLNDYSGKSRWPFEHEDSQDDESGKGIMLDFKNGETKNVRCLDVSSFCEVINVELYITLSDHAKIKSGLSRLRHGKSDVFSYHDDGPPGQSSLRRRLTVMHCGGELPSWAIL